MFDTIIFKTKMFFDTQFLNFVQYMFILFPVLLFLIQ